MKWRVRKPVPSEDVLDICGLECGEVKAVALQQQLPMLASARGSLGVRHYQSHYFILSSTFQRTLGKRRRRWTRICRR